LAIINNQYVEISIVFRLRGGMIDDQQFEFEAPDIDMTVMDNVMLGDDFFMEVIQRIRFGNLRNEY
jgi:hypothetical protein